MSYISCRNIPENTIEERAYQTAIAEHAASANTLVVLPTGMGKTAVALLLAARRLDVGRILILAPTKPLVEQHYRYFTRNLTLDPEEVTMITGETPSEKRVKLFKQARFCAATPEVVKNDLIAERYTLKDVSLLIVDECHRAVGNYAYVFIAQRYNETAVLPLVLGMTASPGSQKEHVSEICSNLAIQQVESRTEDDPDVLPYVHERDVQYIKLDLPEELWLAREIFNSMIDDRISQLRGMNYPVPDRSKLSMKVLNALRTQIQTRMQAKDSSAYYAISVHAELMKLRHGIMLAESQGSTALKAYIQRLISEGTGTGSSKASKRIIEDKRFVKIAETAETWDKEIHPKAAAVVQEIRQTMMDTPDAKIIVFVTYRDSVQMLVDYLNDAGFTAKRFVGQASRDSEKGLSQKQQIEAIRQFRDGEYPVLVATSVGEEGLDIPSTDLVIFYEAVPSEVRSIQRKGRTGRNSSGKITVLITKGTADETYQWVSNAKEKKMLKGVSAMKNGAVPQTSPKQMEFPGEEKTEETSTQMTLADAVISSIEESEEERPTVIVDSREMKAKVAEELSNLGAHIELQQLATGDYAIGSRIVIERKTIQDFTDTLVDRDLFGQMKDLSESAIRPILIIEGGGIADLYNCRNIHPNAIRNTLASIAADYDVSILFTKDATETAQMIYAFAKREVSGPRAERSKHKSKTAHSEAESILYVLTAFPDVGPKAARDLLREFGSLKGLMSASKDDMMTIKGIGEKTASSIVKTFELKWSE